MIPRYFGYTSTEATPIGNYVSGPLKISFRCGRAEFRNNEVTAQLEYFL